MKILVVDDVHFTCTFLQRLLEKAHHKVSVAHDGKEALRFLHANPDMDVVLTDLCMPLMDGMELYQHAQQLPAYNGLEGQQMPAFIMMSARHTKANEESALEAGFKRFLKKPLETDVLFDLLESLRALPEDEDNPMEVVVADSQGQTHEWLASMLADTVHTVVHYRTGQEVLNHVEQSASVSIVIAETDLDDMTGPKLYKRLRALQFKLLGDEKAGDLLPFLLIIEQLSSQQVTDIRDAGIRDVMPKPLDRAAMAQKLSKLHNGNTPMTTKKDPDSVLVVDDVGFNQVVIERVLRQEGLNVLKAQSAYDAIELFKQKSPNIKAVVCDLMMPGMDGMELYRYIQNSDFHKPEFVLITASNDTQRLQEARRMGFFEVLQKPINPGRIKDLVHKMMSGKTAAQHQEETSPPVAKV